MSNPLLKDLEELVSAGIIPAETAKQIESYYQKKNENTPNRFPVILAILGAILVGSGIVLLIAHNWDELSKTLRTIIAFLPLLLGQGLSLFTILRKKDNTAWRESSAVILFFAIPCVISLVSQIYHISGELTSFLLNWLMLGLPIIYLLRSSTVSLLSIAVLTWYACAKGYFANSRYDGDDYPFLYLVGLIILIPHYYKLVKSKNNGAFYHLHNSFFLVSIIITLGTFTDHDTQPSWAFSGYMSLFGLLYLAGRSAYFRKQPLFLNPSLLLGIAGTVIVLLFWSYNWLWEEVTNDRNLDIKDLLTLPLTYLTIIMLAAAVFLLTKTMKTQRDDIFDPVGYTPFVFIVILLAFSKNPIPGIFSVNIWILVIAIYFIRKGAARDHLGILNFGLLIIASLAILRFFDEYIPFVWRGMFFLATGIGFFAANYLLLKKRKALTQNNRS